MNQHKYSIVIMTLPNNTVFFFYLITFNNSFYISINLYLCTLKSCHQVSFLLKLVFIQASHNGTEHIAQPSSQ